MSSCGARRAGLLGLLLVGAALSAQAFIDLNANGMNDIWELAYGAGGLDPEADTDNDGRSNLNESFAGTDPFATGSVVRVIAANFSATEVTLTWPSLAGKRYRVQRAPTVGAITWEDEGGLWVGADTNLAATIPIGAEPNFFRVLIQDVDSDGDGVSDWDELQVGYNPGDPTTGGTNDHDALVAALGAPNQVTVSAIAPYASEEGPVPGAFRITRTGNLNPITISYALGGQAAAGSDYVTPPGSVTLPLGAHTAVVSIDPIPDAVAEASELVALNLQTNGAYGVGTPAGANVIISDPTAPSGTGLLAQYFDNASSTYASPTNFTNLRVTRVDPTVNFIWNAGRPYTTVSNDNFSARWNGILAPSTSGVYTFNLAADDGARLYLTNALIIDAWASGVSTAAPIESLPIALEAGSNYPIRVEYYETTGAANVRLRWRAPETTTFSNISTNRIFAPGSSTNRWVATYFNNATFSGAPVVTALESTVSYDWGVGTPDLAVGLDTFSARWTGQVQPQHSETYTFVARTDDGVKLWVDGQLLVDAWASQSAADRSGAIALQGGVRYDIRMEYFENTSGASAQLSWYSKSQAKQIIPQNRLYPTNAPTAVTSPRTAIAIVGGPFSYKVICSNQPTGVTVTNLPPGLSYDAGTGLITGIPTQAGTYLVLLGATNAAGAAQDLLTLIVLAPGGAITRELWTGVPGAAVTNVPVWTPASATNMQTSLQSPSDAGDDFGERLRGHLTAPLSGNYRFWIASDGPSELWIATDDEPVNGVRRAWVTNATAALQWNADPGQRSALLRLVAGQRYYLEVLHKAASGPDHLAVGWTLPGQTNAAPTEVVPGYVLSPYAAPSIIEGSDTLYVATLTPQGMAVSTGSGVSTLRVNSNETAAVLTVQYGNLTSPFVAAHVHDGAHGGAIIFDLDDAPLVNGAYHWAFEPTGALTVQDILTAIKTGTAYINIHSALYPAGEIKGFYTLAAGSQAFAPPPPPPALPGGAPTPQDAARFLAQATFGATTGDVALVQAIGYDAWLAQQFAAAPSLHLPVVSNYYVINTNDGFSVDTTWNTWWQHAIAAPDQLRQRVAFALSEIMVVSQTDADLGAEPFGLSGYYDMLVTNAFGNFRQLLEDVTLSPVMGDFLDMRRNDKPDPALGRYPNENYAREILQLFSIGMKKVHPDGTLKLTSDGLPIDTYAQEEVVGFAHVFTGWNYGAAGADWDADVDYTHPMRLVAEHHDTGEKLLLDNVVLPANQTGDADLDQALDVIFANANVGPFICRQLIQRLVTSNPSPGYVYRVARVFDDNGAGVRGDMQAVVRAILLDYEARSTAFLASQSYGKQREPVLRVTAVVRGLDGGSTDGFEMGNTDYWLAQTPLGAPTVFNFFEPNYIYPGELAAAGLFAPEFQITSETSVILSDNFLRNGIFSSSGFNGTLTMNLAPQQALAGNVPALVDDIDTRLMAGQMSDAMRSRIITYVSTISSNQALNRVRGTLQLVVTSPEFSIQK